MQSRRISFLAAGLCVALVASSGGWVRASEAISDSPSWIDHPKSDDSVFLYRIGRSEGQKDKTAAQQEAYRNALSVIAGEMMARAGIDENLRTELAANLPVQNAEIVPGGVYTETNQTGFVCWVQVSYPHAEKTKLLERIEPERKKILTRLEFDRNIAALFSEAQSAHARGDHESARTNLQAVIQYYPKLRAPPFDIQDARILLGDTCCSQKDFLAARQYYEEVMQTSESAKFKNMASAKLKALPKAPRAWPLNDRWRGRKIALLCAIRDVGQMPRPFSALGGVLSRDCRESRLESMDITSEIKADEFAAFFDQRMLTAVNTAAKRKGAGIVLAALLTKDPSKHGQTKETMGIAMPVADSEIAFLIVDVEGANTFYGDRFNETSGSRSEPQFAERVASMLIEKYLVPKCPALTPAP